MNVARAKLHANSSWVRTARGVSLAQAYADWLDDKYGLDKTWSDAHLYAVIPPAARTNVRRRHYTHRMCHFAPAHAPRCTASPSR